MKMRIAEAGSIRVVLDGGERFLEVLAAPFGGPERKDKLESKQKELDVSEANFSECVQRFEVLSSLVEISTNGGE